MGSCYSCTSTSRPASIDSKNRTKQKTESKPMSAKPPKTGAELGKAAMYSDLLNTGFDTDLQMPSFERRSTVSMMQQRQCLWRVHKLRSQNLRRKMKTSFLPRPTASLAPSL